MNENENEPYIKSKTVTVTETRTEYAAPEFFDEVEEPEVSGEDHLGRVALMGSDNASAPNPARPRRR